MRAADETTRQRLLALLRESPAQPSDLATALAVTTPAVLEHVEHVARSLESTDEQLLVAPPTCQECGFDSFDDLINSPSRCPACAHESITEPTFTVE